MNRKTQVKPFLFTLIIVATTINQVQAIDLSSNRQTTKPSAAMEVFSSKNQNTTLSRGTLPILREPVVRVVDPCEQYPTNSNRADIQESNGLIICGPDSGIEHEYSGSYVQPQNNSEEEDTPLAYDYFQPGASSFSLTNADLLASASMHIYPPPNFSGNEEIRYTDKMAEFGLSMIDYFNKSNTDTEGAVLANNNTIFVVFRGTAGINDMRSDARVVFTRMDDWDSSIFVHTGFLDSMTSVIDSVIDAIELAQSEGNTNKQVWITGHSLGGAIATLVAYRLYEIENMNVKGVYVFGSPKVGDQGFQDAYMETNLSDRTWRLELEGDPIPTYFPVAPAVDCVTVGIYITVTNCNVPTLLAYKHVGITKQIEAQWNGSEFIYDIQNEEGPNAAQMPITQSGALVEHVKYDNALRDASEQELDPEIVGIFPELIVDQFDSMLGFDG